MSDVVKKNLQEWLDGPIDDLTKKTLTEWKNQNNPIISDLFSHDLEFGTGGIRAVMGVGINRLNIYTIAKSQIFISGLDPG